MRSVTLHLLRTRRELTDDVLDGVVFEGEHRLPYLWRFASLIVLSASIAGFGLLADSPAVVIGAMLVAPLMTPILATAAAIVGVNTRRLWESLAVIGGGMVLAVLTGWLVSFVVGNNIVSAADLPGEVLARTSPGLLDLGIAVTAGAAGGYVLPRRDATGALPGVGIAVALVPPLATVGICLEVGAGSRAQGALLLFATNLAAIVLAASVMLLGAGFGPRVLRHLGIRLAVVVAAVAVVAVPLTLHTRSVIEDAALRRATVEAVEAWDATVTIADLDADVVDGVAHVDILVTGPNPPLPAWRLAELIQDRYDRPVELTLAHEVTDVYEVSVR